MTDKLITIANFAYGPDPASLAELARIKLEAEGIPCFLAGKNFIGVYWLLASADNGVKLQVRQSDAERAIEILNTHEQTAIDQTEYNDPTPHTPDISCPKCNCEDVEYENFSRKLFYLSILFLKFPIPFLKKTYKCNNCGHTWK